MKKKKQETGKGEIHFINDKGERRIEYIDSFPFPEREPDESLSVFKDYITQTVKLESRHLAGNELIAIKWAGPLGYHHGHVLPKN